MKLTLALLSAALLFGCGDNNSDHLQDAIVGGKLTTASKYAAVGAILETTSINGETYPILSFCTGTLVAPNKVLTARHCFSRGREGQIAFALGDDTSAPERIIPITRIVAAPTEGGMGELGSDIAIVELEQAVTDVEPFTVGTFQDSDVDSEFRAVGFGISDGSGDLGNHGLKQVDTVTLAALSGNTFDVLFGDFSTYLDKAPEFFGSPEEATLTDRYWQRLLALYETSELLEGYQAAILSREGHAMCYGDSGGPLIDPKKSVVYGILSATTNDPAEEYLCLGRISVYSTFGPTVLEMFEKEL